MYTDRLRQMELASFVFSYSAKGVMEYSEDWNLILISFFKARLLVLASNMMVERNSRH